MNMAGQIVGVFRDFLLAAPRARYLCTLVLFAALPATAGQVLTFGVYTSDKASSMVKQFRPVMNALERRLENQLEEPVQIRLKVSGTYQGGVDNLLQGNVDFTRLGPASYVLAKSADAGIEVLAMEGKDGKKRFHGIICVREDSGITAVKQLRGKSFAFGDQQSTIGRYLSQRYLRQHGINAAALAGFEYLGRHDRVGAAVAAGQFDAGALKESTFRKLVAKGAPLRAIARFENVTKPWVARSDLDPRILESLRRSLLSLSDESALKALKKSGFIVGSDGDYAATREAINSSALFHQSP